MISAHLAKGGANIVMQLGAACKVHGDRVLPRGNAHNWRRGREQPRIGRKILNSQRRAHDYELERQHARLLCSHLLAQRHHS